MAGGATQLRSRGKQRYYAAIVQEAALKRSREETPSYEEVSNVDNGTYEEIGKKSLAAFSNLLDILSGARTSPALADPVGLERRIGEQLATVVASLDLVRRDLAALASRTDRALLELLKRIEPQEGLAVTSFPTPSLPASQVSAIGTAGPGTGGRAATPSKPRGKYERVPKEQTREKILEAARELAAAGRKITLAECARMADVAYYKAVYACKDSEELEELMSGNAG